MERIVTKLRRFTPSKNAKTIFMIAFLLWIVDSLVVVLGTSFLNDNAGNFWGKSPTVMLSDLLFLEGVAIFVIGTLIRVARAMQETRPTPEPTTEITDNPKQTLEKPKNSSVLVMIAGALLIVLSVIIGSLPH